MKIAYVATWDLGNDDAVCRKLEKQLMEWEDLGCEGKIFAISERPSTRAFMVGNSVVFLRKRETGKGILGAVNKLFNTSKCWRALISSVKEWGADVVYLRQQSWSPGVSKLLKAFPTVVEINSKDLAESDILLQQSGSAGAMLHYYRSYTRGYLYKNARGLVAVTHELLNSEDFSKYGLPGIVIPNSVRFGSGEHVAQGASSPQGDLPVLIMVAAGGRASVENHWHGVDKILKLAALTIGKLNYIVIGNEKVEELNPPSNVRVVSRVSPDDLIDLYEQADIAFGTLALHRKDMNEACPFKVREALSCGLPVILGYIDTAFVGEEIPPWVLEIPNVEKNLMNFESEILNFCKEWHGRRVLVSEVKPFIDSQIIESKKLDFLKSLCN